MFSGKRARTLCLLISLLGLITGALFLFSAAPAQAQSCTNTYFHWSAGDTNMTGWNVIGSEVPAPPVEMADPAGTWTFSLTSAGGGAYEIRGSGYQGTHHYVGGLYTFSSACQVASIGYRVHFQDSTVNESVRLYVNEGGTWTRIYVKYYPSQTVWNYIDVGNRTIDAFAIEVGTNKGHVLWGVDIYPTSGPTVTPTNTPNLTYTPTPGVLNPVGIPYPTCVLLGNDAARFANGFPTWYREGTPYQYDTTNGISVLIPSTNAVYRALILDPKTQYKIDVRYRSRSPAAGEIFSITLGKSVFHIPIPVAPDYPDLYSSTWESPPANFEPSDPGSWYFEIRRANGLSVDLIIDYICVSAVQASTAPVNAPGQPGTDASGCRVCDNPVDALDIGGIINWVLCQILRFFECFIGYLIQRIVLFVISLLAFFYTFAKFISDVIGGGIGFMLDSAGTVGRFAQGFGSNIGTGMVNAFHTSGAADTFNHVSRGIQDLPTLFGNFFTDAGTTITQAFQSGANILDVIGALISLTIKGIGFVIGIIPVLLQGLISGFNAGAQSMSGAMITCDNPSDLWFYPCVGFYVLDNTIFQGPAVYIVPVIIGLWSFETLIWAQEKLRSAFSSG